MSSEEIVTHYLAHVRVKALQWREEYQKWSADSYIATATGVGCTYIIASSMDDPNHDAVVDAKKAAAQADYEARIITALEPDARIEELVEALRGLVQLNNDYSPFGGELLQDRVDRTWQRARAALAKLETRT